MRCSRANYFTRHKRQCTATWSVVQGGLQVMAAGELQGEQRKSQLQLQLL